MSRFLSSKRVIAVTGKGGTGKTVLTAITAGILARQERYKILVIDADPAVGTPHALGTKVDRTVGDIREEIIEDPEARSKIADQHIKTVVTSLLRQGDGFQLLVMGRSEGPGCFCSVNDLLRYGIETLSRDFDITLIDGEAGPEQINRRVIQSVDTMIIVTDASIRGIYAAALIARIAQSNKAMETCEIGLVINRVRDEHELMIRDAAQQTGLKILSCIPEDEIITQYDLIAKPIIALPECSPSVEAVRQMLRRMDLIAAT